MRRSADKSNQELEALSANKDLFLFAKELKIMFITCFKKAILVKKYQVLLNG